MRSTKACGHGLGLLLLTAAGCSSVALTDRVGEGDPCRVEYHSAATGSVPRLVLVNESGAEGGSASDEPVSRIDDDKMRVLVTDFENIGFFEKAGSALPSGEPFIAIVTGRGAWVLPKSAMRDKWIQLVSAVQEMWNRGDRTVMTASRGRGRDLRADAARIEQRNAEIRKRLLERRQ